MNLARIKQTSLGRRWLAEFIRLTWESLDEHQQGRLLGDARTNGWWPAIRLSAKRLTQRTQFSGSPHKWSLFLFRDDGHGREPQRLRSLDDSLSQLRLISQSSPWSAGTPCSRAPSKPRNHVAPRPWEASLDDPHDEQDNGEYDNGEWVITDANDCEIDRSAAGSRWEDGVTNGGWAREYVADVNALGTTVATEETNDGQ